MADPDLSVTRRDDGAFDVRIRDASGTTHHVVTVPQGLPAEFGWHDDAELVRTSFEFLLEREPATSILSRFGLDVIGRYFPEYREEMRRRAGA